jgi:hypothetical protein
MSLFTSISQEKAFLKFLENYSIEIPDLFEISNIKYHNIFEIAIKYNNAKLLEHIKNMDINTLYNLKSSLSESPIYFLIIYNNITMYEPIVKLFPCSIERSFEKAIMIGSNNFVNFLIDIIEPNQMTIGILMKLLRKPEIEVSTIEKFFRKLELNVDIRDVKKNFEISNYLVKNKKLYLLNLIIELGYLFAKNVVMSAIETNDILIVESILKKVTKENNIKSYDFDFAIISKPNAIIDQDIINILKSSKIAWL